MVDRKIFAINFEPVAQIGERVFLLPQKTLHEIEWIEPIPKLDLDFGAISAGATVSEVEKNELYVESDELAQWRFIPVTDKLVVTGMWCPKALKYWTTKNGNGDLSWNIDYMDVPVETLQLTEFFQHGIKTRVFSLKNTGTADISASIVRFYGYIFELSKKIEEIEKPYIAIPTESRLRT